MDTKIKFGFLALTVFILSFAVSLQTAGWDIPAPTKLFTLAQNNEPSAPVPILLTDQQEKYPLGLYLDILEDPSGDLTIEQVSSPEYDAQFVPSQDEAPNYGFTNSVYWVRFCPDNETRRTVEWLLEVDFANMHYVDLYTPLPDGEGFDVKQTGLLRPASTRDVTHPQIVFNLVIPTMSQPAYYLRFQNGGSMTLGLTLWSNDAFLDDTQWQHLLSGLFFGTMIALLLYNLFLLLSLHKERHLYFYFVLELAAAIFFVASYDGYLEVYFFPNFYYAAQYYLPLSYALLFIAIVLFADTFLQTKKNLPRFHRANLAILGGWGVLVLLTPFISYHLATDLFAPWAMLSMVVVLVAGIISWLQRYRPSRLLLLAWFGLCVTIIIAILVSRGIIPVTMLSQNLFRLGMIVLGVCGSFALADRINLLQDQTESAKQELQNNERRLSQILDSMPVGVVLYGKDFKPSYINQRTIDILSNPAQGIRPELTAGRTLAQAIQYYSFRLASSGQEYPLEAFPPFSALQGKAATADDIEMDQGDRHVALEFWASPIMDDARNVEFAVVAFQDITRRKQVEAELTDHRKHLESLVEKRTTELDTANKELLLRLEWMSAIALVTETMARSSDFTQIYAKIIEIINHLFAIPDSFIAELDEGRKQLYILAHSCCNDLHPALSGLLTTLPEDILSDTNLEPGKLVFVSRDQLNTLNGPIGQHIQNEKIQGMVLVPLQLSEQVFGFLGLEMCEQGKIITAEEASLLSIFSVDIAQLIQASRFYEQTRALITAEERNRLARELHDAVTETLFTASVLAEATPRLWDKDPGVARQNMDKLSLLIRGALAEMRSMLIELRSEELDNQTLDRLLFTLGEAARVHSRAVITISITEVTELPQNVTIALYRIAQEALNNAMIHASATRINVSLFVESGEVMLRIQDDGCGFDPRAVHAGHQGISMMLERAAEIGGDLRFHSEPDRGTDILLTWPGKAGGSEEYYILKNAAIDTIANAIQSAYSRQPAPEIETTVVPIPTDPGWPNPESDLSKREQDVLALIVEGLTNEEIAERLVISPATAKHHVAACIQKLGATNRAQAAALAVKKGLVA